MSQIQLVTIVANGGTPMQLCDQKGAPYPTTGFGALVFNTGPTIEDAILINPTFQLTEVHVGRGTFTDPAVQFTSTDDNTPGLFASGPGNITLVGTSGVESSRAVLASFDHPGNITIPQYAFANGIIPPADDSNTLATTAWVRDTMGSVPITGPAGGVLSGTYPDPGFAINPTFSGTLTVTGAASIGLPGGVPTITGLDAGNLPLRLAGSHNGGIDLMTNSGVNFLARFATQGGGTNVNYFSFLGAQAGAGLGIAATGGDVNIGITLTPKGSGLISVPTRPPGDSTTAAASTAFVSTALGTGPFLPLAGGVVTGTITSTLGSVVVSTPAFDISETWNAAGVNFETIRANITRTAAADPSYLIHMLVGGVNTFSVDRFGTGIFNAGGFFGGDITIDSGNAIPAGGTQDRGINMSTTAHFGLYFGSGVPNKVQAQGSWYQRSDATATNPPLYFNTDGTGTGWLPLQTQSGTMRLFDEQILAATATEIRVAIPANTKLVHIEYFIGNNVAADFQLVMQAMQGATPFIGTTYSVQSLAGSGTVGSAAFSGGVGFWNFGLSANYTGWVSLRYISSGWYGNMNEYGIQAAGTVTNNGVAMRCDVTASTITGFRLISNGGASVFAVGSFMRCFVIT